MNYQDKFWLTDPMVLFRGNNYYKFLPTSSMNKTEILNALTRFFLYLTILYIIFAADIEYIYIPIIAIVIIIMLYYIQQSDPKNNNEENFSSNNDNNNLENSLDNNNFNDNKFDNNSVCQMPSKNNPFMNLTLADLMDRPNRPPACNSLNEIVNDQMIGYLNENVFKDVNDVFDRGFAQRQFYTMPVTTVVNDQTKFAKWLYRLPETCKENQENCLKYEDIRFNRFNPIVDKTMP